MITETTTLAAFYQALPQDQFLAVDHDEKGRLYYPVEEGLAGTAWQDQGRRRPTLFLDASVRFATTKEQRNAIGLGK